MTATVHRSRGAFCVRGLLTTTAHDPEKWTSGFRPSRSPLRRPKEGRTKIMRNMQGRRSAERRMPSIVRPSLRFPPPCGGGLGGGSEARRRQVYAVCANHLHRGALAFRRFAAVLAREFPRWLSSRPCLPGLECRRALPASSGPSTAKAPRASVVMPKRLMPKAAPARTANPRGSTALAPPAGVAS